MIRLGWLDARLHVGTIALGGIAAIAACYYVVPACDAPSSPWYHMVDGHVFDREFVEAILAAEMIPEEEIRPAEPHVNLLLGELPADHDAGYVQCGAWAMNLPILVEFNRSHGPEPDLLNAVLPPDRADWYAAQRSVISV